MKYNRSLDLIALAMAHGSKGNAVTASKLFAKAIQSPDAGRAVAILEASNADAFKAQAKKAKPAVKAAVKTSAAKRIKANEEFMDDLGAEDEVEAGMEDEDLDLSSMEDIDASFGEEEEEEEDEGSFDEQFAKVLASMNAKKRK